ncbi:cysteine-rich motor neuron 1 protein-like isoform X1 [Astyanax mexicanus]|uniref:Cysteine-rich motor neuron 1 protein-like isoform X1 n=1 Tax=Astyanax mexicanus TaxID=7994 RepID=A0A8T2LFV4_ASTMX|nr:cysteine-rich motor neuron 1 protein-like isoform X1 [Astyanax mexicanus]
MHREPPLLALLLLLLFLHFPARMRALPDSACTPCARRVCPSEAAVGAEDRTGARACEDGTRALARDPCGCCAPRCTRLALELCGGTDWTLGYCGLGLTCAALNRTGAADIPEVGVCKELRGAADAGAEDERCPLLSGCDRVSGECVCESTHSCIRTFRYPSRESCARAAKTEARRHEQEHRDSRHKERFVGPANPACIFSGCNLTAKGCECTSQSCHAHFTYANRSQCQLAAEELKCAGIICPTLPPADCPPDSVLTHSYTPPGGCCPTLPPQCTCSQCPPQPECPSGHRAVLINEATGAPGNCCHTYDCQRVSPRCVHNGKKFAEGEVYRMDSCWLCQCRGGVSFCSKAECAELDCDNFYIPEGECCPVCIDVELLSVESTKASCWVNHKLRQHEEQWKEDDCTFCQCVDGEPQCTAMACKQTCQNPVKIPGECCPFCEEPSYETVSPLLCPPLQNCSLSAHDCPFGFQQDHNGCLRCQCLGNDSCPELSRYCNLQCLMGYEKDDFGCEVCECSLPSNCKPLTCSKTCPYGYMRNKHGCEMCRCIKCPPFTCDKQCSEGYKQNRKGCSVCLCKEGEHAPSTTTPPPPPPLPSFCLTAQGQRFEEGDGWHDGCRECYCHAGREMCVLISCPVPSCKQPVLRPHQCCPTCEDEVGSGQPEGMDMVVCRAPGGDLYVEGETWNLDECTRCTCRQGRVLCDTEACPPTLCQAPIRSKDTCCYTCPEDSSSSLLPVNTSQREYCISSEGDVLLAGESWKPNACTSCICNNGTVQCFSQRCPVANCRVPVLRKGQCCPHCLEVTTTSVPMMVSTTMAKPKTNTTASTTTTTTITTTSSSSTTTERTVVLTTTHTRPPVVAITDDRGLSKDGPSQAEMSLIYQSAAWILAGLLLAIVIFLIVAILINKKKKWVQMSCYSAPKKAVILKKHVNKNSVVYMEPSKENKFQSVKNDCGVTFSPDVSSPCGERISIPRAKLGNGHARVQR